MSNNYSISEYRKQNERGKQLSKKQLNEIDNRRLYAMRANDIEEIKDAKSKIINIIDNDGLQNDNAKIRLETALKTLIYVTPQLKSTETVVITKKIEDIIQESTELAEFTEEPEDGKNSDDKA